MLEVDGISISFGGLRAVSDFRLRLAPGALQGLIGPNGAGKTTIFNLLTGIYQPEAGTVRLSGKVLNGLKTWQIAEAGLSRTFQNIRLFPDLSVLDNVRVGAHLRTRSGLAAALARTPGSGRRRAPSPPVRASCCPSSDWTAGGESWPRTSPMATAAAWRSPGRWPPIPRCSSSTSPPRG
jgi:ABC-type branched-subunit amino acid transport system ATPase component